MPTLMLKATATALGANASLCDSRSLVLDRFVYENPEINDSSKIHFSQVCENTFSVIGDIRNNWTQTSNNPKINPTAQGNARRFLEDTQDLSKRSSWIKACAIKPKSNHCFLSSLTDASILYARLCSRMMLNMSGGVMENANICLDRYGIPYIPGSAVKGCARRAALAALREWNQTSQKPAGDDNVFTVSCAPFGTPNDMLEAIANVFGWGDADWKQGSDFLWAMAGTPIERGGDILSPKPETRGQDAHAPFQARGQDAHAPFDSFAGSVAFLPAYPNTDPGLELDVLTCHHGDYYSSDDPDAVAHDTENPIPVVFPAVKSQEGTQNYYSFPLVPLRGANAKLVEYARTWLKCGLETFGIGAKTAAGYGWFDCSEIAEQMRREEEQQREQRELDALVPCPALMKKFSETKTPDLAGILNKYAFEEKFWPKGSTPIYERSLFEYIKSKTSDPATTKLATTKNGKKAMSFLAAKFKLPFP